MELALVGVVVGLAVWCIERARWRRRYGGIVDVEREIAGRRQAANAEIASAKQTATHEVAHAMREAAALTATTARIDELRRELAVYEQLADDATVGLLPP